MESTEFLPQTLGLSHGERAAKVIHSTPIAERAALPSAVAKGVYGLRQPEALGHADCPLYHLERTHGVNPAGIEQPVPRRQNLHLLRRRTVMIEQRHSVAAQANGPGDAERHVHSGE